ncbi:MAG: hypothetical protein H7235_09205 [Bdellovibrionaceae bacterium]|nr:hypothetical protein [Pseudobdellovibrionaceae bacterium]
MIKKSAITMFLANGLIFIVLGMYFNSGMAISFLFSSTLLLINYVVLAVMWKYIILRQQAGLAALVALIKYPLIGISIYWAGRQAWMNSIGITIGICAFLIIIVLSSLIHKDRKNP